MLIFNELWIVHSGWATFSQGRRQARRFRNNAEKIAESGKFVQRILE
jgi:hypothetical protein